MNEMNELEKVRVMLPHWLEHNHGHGAEFSRWAEKLKNGSPEIADLLHRAAQALKEAQSCLEAALDRSGGSLHVPGHTHHHSGGHHHNSSL